MALKFRLIASIAGLALIAGGMSACSAEAVTSECVLIVGNGGSEPHVVKKVVYPGESVGDEGDDWKKYLPCGPRNFIINPPNDKNYGDRHTPSVGWTNASADGKSPAMQVKVWSTANWELNQNLAVLKDFWVFCQKYGCSSDQSQDNSANFSSPGWNGMLGENMSPAIDRAVAKALLKFSPELWRSQDQWGKLAGEISNNIMNELKDPLSGHPFFCGRGSDSRNKGECKPIKFTIDQPGVEPVDAQIVQITNNAQAATADQLQDQQRIDRTNKLYGPYADYYRGLQDTIDKCKSADKCQIYVGTQPNVKP